MGTLKNHPVMISGSHSVSSKGTWYLLFLLFFWAVGFCSPAYAMGRNPKELKPYNPNKIEIKMKVDFGLAGKPLYEGPLMVEEDSTAKEALSQVFPIRTGTVCCSLQDVSEVDGVSVVPEKNWWWICLRNGSKNFSPRRDKLKAGDHIEWRYIGTADSARKDGKKA